MGKFQLKIDVEPDDIPSLDDAHKRDCADALNRVINSTFKYTLIFSVVIAAFFAAYSLFGLTYVLRMGTALPQLPFTMLIIAMLIAVFEFVSGTMKRWALFLEVILHATLIWFSIMQVITVIAAPFAFYGIILHVKLITLLPHYNVISQLKGFPYFTSLPIGDVIKKAEPEKDENKASENEEISESKENTPEEEKKGPAEAEDSPNDEKEKLPEPEELPKLPEEETDKPKKEENVQQRQQNNPSRKNKKKKRKKSSK